MYSFQPLLLWCADIVLRAGAKSLVTIDEQIIYDKPSADSRLQKESRASHMALFSISIVDFLQFAPYMALSSLDKTCIILAYQVGILP